MKENFIDLIKAAGVIGAGGAGFPTHVKLNAKAEYVIVNGAECEPLLQVDQQLMAVKTQEILTALQAAVWHTGAKKGIIALKKKYKQAIESLQKSIGEYENLDIFTMDNFYPAGDEQVTVYEVLQRIVPEGGIPLQVNVVVLNVETLLNIHMAMEGVTVTHKYLTVTGAVNKPVTVRVPVGIRVREAIELAGGASVEEYEVIDGGPMMGKVLERTDKPITKTTKGIIVLPKDHPLILSKKRSIESMLRQARAACCHCSLCTEVCPRNLLGHKLHPDKLMRLASYNSACENDASVTAAFLCCECGLCEQACIMNLQPWKLNQLLKRKLGSAGVKNPNNRTVVNVNGYREFRKFPVKKLILRLGLEKYDVAAPLQEDIREDFSSVVLERKQHIGAKAEPMVEVGDSIAVGQPVADVMEGQLGARVHGSISGKVHRVDEHVIEICKI
ncbi:MAG: SLBB domain-containing protein [Bacillota bacterium]